MDYLIFSAVILLVAGATYYWKSRKRRDGAGRSAPRDGDGPPKFKH